MHHARRYVTRVQKPSGSKRRNVNARRHELQLTEADSAPTAAKA
jgi:hypothetical protein